MQVILNEDVANLGEVGDIVNVADGYGRNFLIPRKLAMPATTRNVRELAHTKRVIAAKRAKMVKSAEELAKKLQDLSVTIAKAVGEEDKLFGSVTNREIVDAINEEGFNIDKRQVQLATPIKNLGVYTVAVKIHGDISAQIKVWVVSEAV